MKNTAQFNRFAGYLAGYYKGNSDYVNFMYGKYFYSLQDFRTSFYYFNKVTGTENAYCLESWFNLGNISLFADKNKQQAIAFYQKIIDRDMESDFGYRARIELSIIYHEINRKDESLKLLREIIAGPSHKIYHVQAQNLYDSFIKLIPKRLCPTRNLWNLNKSTERESHERKA
jgi:tetratricopeptide (TPR) repeat protein